MIAVKRLLVEVLRHRANAMLLDPNCAFPAALDRLPARTGIVAFCGRHLRAVLSRDDLRLFRRGE